MKAWVKRPIAFILTVMMCVSLTPVFSMASTSTSYNILLETSAESVTENETFTVDVILNRTTGEKAPAAASAKLTYSGATYENGSTSITDCRITNNENECVVSYYDNTSSQFDADGKLKLATFTFKAGSSDSIFTVTEAVATEPGSAAAATVSLPSTSLTVKNSINLIVHPWEGSGTENDPYLITSSEDLYALSQNVSAGENYSGAYFKLMQDIQYSKEAPIGEWYCNSYNWPNKPQTVSEPFSGNFNGNDHSITISLTSDYAKSKCTTTVTFDCYYGLFGYIENAVIHDLTVKGTLNYNDTFETSYQGEHRVGSIAGRSESSTIAGCISEVEMTSDMQKIYFGGICGDASESTISNCLNYGNLTIKGSNSNYMGGIVGYGYISDVYQCGNFGMLTCNVEATFNDSTGDNTSGGWHIYSVGTMGGIAGSIAGNVQECLNKGDLFGAAQYQGGIVGRSYSKTTLSEEEIYYTVENCYNVGAVLSTSEDNLRSSYSYIGGLGIGEWQKSYSIGEVKYVNKPLWYRLGTIMGFIPSGVDYTTKGISTTAAEYRTCYEINDVYDINDSFTASDLSNAFVEDTDGKNSGYPMLSWENTVQSGSGIVDFTVNVDGAKVTVYSDSEMSKEVPSNDGKYTIPYGVYYYQVEKEGYVTEKGGFSLFAQNKTVEVSLYPSAVVKFNKNPSDLTLEVSDSSGVVLPDRNVGESSVYTLYDGRTYTYTAAAAGYNSTTHEFTAEPDLEINVKLVTSEYGANNQFIYGDKNEGKPHTITKGGIYSIGEGATGVMTIDTTEPVTLIGRGMSDDFLYENLFIGCKQAGSKLTLQDVGIHDTENTANLVNFTGKDNVLSIEGVCLLDYDFGYTEKHDALIHVPQNCSLTINGAGTLYQYNCTQGAGIGGDTGEMNGEITFAMTGSAFIKGTKQGAVIGAGANAKSSGEAPGSITFESGTYNLETNSRGAAIGGSAGSGGASSGTEVYIKGGNININCDFTGSAVGGGGYQAGNDASGGTVYITGGSLRTYIDKNAANNEYGGFNNAAFTEGVNDAVITAQRLNDSGDKVYKCVFDTSELGDGPYTIQIDGKDFYNGGRHAWAYVNEALSKDEGAQINVSRTQDNWIPNDEPNLYFYLTGQDHTITVGDRTYQAVFDSSVLDADGHIIDNKVYTEGAFTVKEVEVVKPQYPVTLPSSIGHGQLDADRNQAEEGETVKLTPVAEEGFELEVLTVKDQDGNEVDLNDNGDGSFCFTMPDGPVTVEVSFRESEPDDHDASCPSKAFSDLDTGKWYHEAIDYVLLRNYFNGVGDGKFAPDGTMTRAMFVTVLGRAAGVEEDKNAHSSFSDVADGKWYTTYVDWAAQNDIVDGYDSKTFGPDDFITREQMAVILYRYARYKGVDVKAADDAKYHTFRDADQVSNYAKVPMIWAVDKGIINGMGDGTLAPQKTATRAQVAQLLMNFDQKLA